ncbi:pitrilysin family protein [Oleiagrimonas sp. C23AA]|uniref:M16 family metallopeptidase n=1 Tax=Oleiagrimonas sp. C23AA TaxID=2719047 RepID=UPI00141FC4DA|nr:pitrilysin family protein [Oleiagrimonas sp. C23AA]NII09358.1 insulinase family protein [Oleiagrimonas sp. C23AA]
MRNCFKPLALAMALSGLLATTAPAAAAKAPVKTRNHVLRATLNNGLRVVIVRDTLAPMVTTQITYLAGGFETPRGFPGTAHALEHMMFRDSKGMTGAQLNEMTGKMGGENNAFTTMDATQYYFVAPAAYTDVLLHIEAARMEGAKLTNKDWNLEKGAIEQEVSRDISDPGYLAFQQAERTLYAGTGYAEDALGSRPSFDKTDSKILTGFYRHWYAPNNAIFVIVGDVDPASTLQKVKQLFGDIPERPTPKRTPVKLAKVKSTTITKTTPDATGAVQFMYRLPGLKATDAAAAQVLMDALGNPRSGLSKLAADGKVLSADTWAQNFSRGAIGVVEVGVPKDGDAGDARQAMNQVIERIRQHGVPADLVAAAKRAELAQSEFNKNSSVDLASAWSQALAWQGLDSPAAADAQIRKVTVADVDRVARQYLTPDARVTVVLTPNPNGKRPPQSAGFGGSESFASNDKLDVPLPSWAEHALKQLKMPHWTLDPTTMKLANGITLIVQPEHVSKTVTVYGQIDQNENLQAPKGQKGVSRVLSSLFDYGTTHLDRDAFHKALDAIAARESAGPSFSLAVPVQHFDRGMQLLADNELHPALPASAFTIKQHSIARELAGQMQSPRYKMNRALMKGLYPAGDPDLRQATPAKVSKLTLANARKYFADTYRPDMTTITVVGDITPAQAKQVVQKYFGAWHAQGPKPDVISPKVPLNPAHYQVVANPYASQDTVLMAQTVDLNLHDPQRYALELGNDVLGGNGFASRLMVDVRVRHGYAYGASSGLNFGRSRSMFYVYYGSDPGKVAKVDALVRQDLGDMRTQPVKADELTNARQFEIRSIPLQVASVDRIARSLTQWNINGEPLDQPMVAARHYLNLSDRQVQQAFSTYLKPDHLVQVVQGPAPAKH